MDLSAAVLNLFNNETENWNRINATITEQNKTQGLNTQNQANEQNELQVCKIINEKPFQQSEN